jgi:hypothetical protein
MSGKKTQKTLDEVNSPAHYAKGGIECIEAIRDSMTSEAYRGYLKGSVLKYLWRYESKGSEPEKHLLKAQWFLERLLETFSEPSPKTQSTPSEQPKLFVKGSKNPS